MSWNVELPASTPIRKGERCGEMIEKVAAGDGFGAQGGDVRGRLLAIHQAKSPRLELADQRDQGDFRGIGRSREHRLCEKGATERHAIEPADQLSFLPGFNGMRIALFV